MKYRPLGRTGLQVSTLCPGTAHLGSFTDLDESVRIIQTDIHLGVNWIDTASTCGGHRFSIDDAPEDRPMVEEIVPRYLRAATRLAEMAGSRGHTAAQEAMAWVLGYPAVTSVVSAASSVAQLEANIPAFELELSEEEREEISEVVAEEAG